MYVEQIKLTTNLSGKPNLITMTNETAFNNDNYKTAPPLVDRLRQILKQHSKAVNAEAAAVLSMDEEEALIAAGELAVTA
jgi:glutamine synthetase type III